MGSGLEEAKQRAFLRVDVARLLNVDVHGTDGAVWDQPVIEAGCIVAWEVRTFPRGASPNDQRLVSAAPERMDAWASARAALSGNK